MIRRVAGGIGLVCIDWVEMDDEENGMRVRYRSAIDEGAETGSWAVGPDLESLGWGSVPAD